ncbi:C-GCAxxG-C-C family (seleno)protein [Peptoniphilus sp.]|uniref:C-GCAxxG-C-C family (seleno)protein n=1 Tax=Peptoniphilus sp. TaxID=1971214 RepID=UPI00399576D5
MLSKIFLRYMDEATNHGGPMYNCAEAIILAVDEEYELNLPEEVVKSVAGFGGGMGAGSTCGYLTGAISALSLIFGPEEPPYGTMDLAAICAVYVENFEKLGNSIDCVDLIAENPPCIDLGVKSLDLLQEVIEQNKTK